MADAMSQGSGGSISEKDLAAGNVTAVTSAWRQGLAGA